MTYTGALAALVLSIVGLSVVSARSIAGDATPPSAHQLRMGKNVFKAACAGCHKWHGGGGGGYGGAALSLRKTELSRDQIIETVRCGRPGTGMPSHDREAYKDKSCYGMTKEEAGNNLPPVANSYLSASEIQDVADYVIANVKGKGDPTLEECLDFWGSTSQVCNEFKKTSSEEKRSQVHIQLEVTR